MSFASGIPYQQQQQTPQFTSAFDLPSTTSQLGGGGGGQQQSQLPRQQTTRRPRQPTLATTSIQGRQSIPASLETDKTFADTQLAELFANTLQGKAATARKVTDYLSNFAAGNSNALSPEQSAILDLLNQMPNNPNLQTGLYQSVTDRACNSPAVVKDFLDTVAQFQWSGANISALVRVLIRAGVLSNIENLGKTRFDDGSFSPLTRGTKDKTFNKLLPSLLFTIAVGECGTLDRVTNAMQAIIGGRFNQFIEEFRRQHQIAPGQIIQMDPSPQQLQRVNDCLADFYDQNAQCDNPATKSDVATLLGILDDSRLSGRDILDMVRIWNLNENAQTGGSRFYSPRGTRIKGSNADQYCTFGGLPVTDQTLGFPGRGKTSSVPKASLLWSLLGKYCNQSRELIQEIALFLNQRIQSNVERMDVELTKDGGASQIPSGVGSVPQPMSAQQQRGVRFGGAESYQGVPNTPSSNVPTQGILRQSNIPSQIASGGNLPGTAGYPGLPSNWQTMVGSGGGNNPITTGQSFELGGGVRRHNGNGSLPQYAYYGGQFY